MSPLGIIMKAWTDEISEATGGRVKITHYGAASLVKMQDTYDALVSGLCDLAVVEPGMTPGSFPLSEIVNLPMLFPSGVVTGQAYYELTNKYLVDTELRDIKFLWILPLSPMQVISTKPIQKLEDMKGMKIRIEGKVEDMSVKAFGGTGILMSTMEMYTSFERGLIECAFFLYNGIFAYGFQEVTKYRTKADLFCRGFLVSMNKDSWNNLPPDIQKIFEEHGGITFSKTAGIMIDQNEVDALQRLIEYDKKAGNPGLYILPDDEKTRWVETLLSVRNAWAQEKEEDGLPGKAMLEDAISLAKKYSQ